MIRRVVLLTGSRNWPHPNLVRERVEAACAAQSTTAEVMLIHGHCKTGADSHADRYASKYGCVVVRLPYFDWMGKAGGPNRNRALLSMLIAQGDLYECPISVEAFPLGESKGTRGMIKLADEAMVDVWVTSEAGVTVKL